jgi:hypothetical protein
MPDVIPFLTFEDGIAALNCLTEAFGFTEVTVNGKRRYIAGHADEHSLQLILWGNNRFEPRGASINTFGTVPSDSQAGLRRRSRCLAMTA